MGDDSPDREVGSLRRRMRLLAQEMLPEIVALAVVLSLIGAICTVGYVKNRNAKHVKRTTQQMQFLRSALVMYSQEFGEFPGGVNQDIACSLTGTNAKGMPFFTLSRREVSQSGEIVDMWGSPFRFIRRADDSIRIVSAGPDCVFGTADDIQLDENGTLQMAR